VPRGIQQLEAGGEHELNNDEKIGAWQKRKKAVRAFILTNVYVPLVSPWFYLPWFSLTLSFGTYTAISFH
jgi:hypothetical protein